MKKVEGGGGNTHEERNKIAKNMRIKGIYVIISFPNFFEIFQNQKYSRTISKHFSTGFATS